MKQPSLSLSDYIYIVLVAPGESLNVGSVARLMSNLGFERMRIVSAPRYDRARAEITACWGTPVLDRAEFYADLCGALSDIEDVVAFSAVSGKNRPPPVGLIEWAEQVRASALQENQAHESGMRKTALLFGPEDTGLLQEHLDCARLCVAIPAHPNNPSFNLSNAVLLALYELSRGASALTIPVQSSEVKAASGAQVEQLDQFVAQLAEVSGFYHQGTSEGVRSVMKNLVRRMQPNEREMQMMLGLFSNALKKASR